MDEIMGSLIRSSLSMTNAMFREGLAMVLSTQPDFCPKISA
jgi:hypothetical protein